MPRLLLTLLFFCCWHAHAYAEKPRIVASFSILGDMVAQVGGEDIELTTLIGTDSDPHAFSPTPAHAALLSKANLVIINGLGFEGWLARLVDSSGYKGEVIAASRGVTPIYNNTNADFHAWQDAANGKIYIANIRDALIKIDAAHAPAYTQRAKAAMDKISALDSWIKKEISSIPPENRKVMSTHNSFAYYAHAYGIRFIAPIGISTDSEPSAADIARLVDQLRAQHLQAIFIENISANRLGEQLSRDTGAHIGGTLYSDALSSHSGPAASYEGLLRHNTQQITAALHPSR